MQSGRHRHVVQTRGLRRLSRPERVNEPETRWVMSLKSRRVWPEPRREPRSAAD